MHNNNRTKRSSRKQSRWVRKPQPAARVAAQPAVRVVAPPAQPAARVIAPPVAQPVVTTYPQGGVRLLRDNPILMQMITDALKVSICWSAKSITFADTTMPCIIFGTLLYVTNSSYREYFIATNPMPQYVPCDIGYLTLRDVFDLLTIHRGELNQHHGRHTNARLDAAYDHLGDVMNCLSSRMC